jgi:tetratricopeptide (TPR) repeat protein/transcriptional regulator with XRE-family HTH domain
MPSFGQMAIERIDKLRNAGQKNALSLERIAADAHLSKRALEKWRSGETQNPSDENVVAALVALGIDRDQARIEVNELKRASDRQVVVHSQPPNRITESSVLESIDSTHKYSQKYGIFIELANSSLSCISTQNVNLLNGYHSTTIDCDCQNAEWIMCEVSDFLASCLAMTSQRSFENYYRKSSLIRSTQRSLKAFHSYGNASEILRLERQHVSGDLKFPFAIERVLAAGLKIELLSRPGTELLRELLVVANDIQLSEVEQVKVNLVGLSTFPISLFERISEILRETNIRSFVRFVVITQNLDDWGSEGEFPSSTTVKENLAVALAYGITRLEGRDEEHTKPSLDFKKSILERYFAPEVSGKLVRLTRSDYAVSAESPKDILAQRLLGRFLVAKDFSALDQCVVRFARGDWDLVSRICGVLLSAANLMIHPDILFIRRAREAVRVMNLVRLGKVQDKGVQLVFDRVLYESIKLNDLELSVEAAYQISYSSFLAGDFIKAYDVLADTRLQGHLTAPSLSFLASVAHVLNHNEEATRFLEQSLKIRNDYEYTHFYLGVIKDEAGLYEEAIDHYVSAILLCPSFYEAAFNLTNSLLRVGRFLDAARMSSYIILSHDATAAELISNLAVALSSSGYSSAALAMLKASFASRPAAITAYNIAVIYYQRRQDSQCEDWIDIVLRDSPSLNYTVKPAAKLRRALKKRPPVQAEEISEMIAPVDQEMGADIALIFVTHGFDPNLPGNLIVERVQKALRLGSRPPAAHMPSSQKRVLLKKVADAKLQKERENKKAATSRTAAGDQPQFLRAPSYCGG